MSGPFDYVTGIPAANNNPSSDQPKMQTNFNSISNLIAVDHIGFNTAPTGGYHNVIHITQAPLNTDPSVITTAGQLYTKTIAGNLQLFFESTSGVVSRLSPTGPNFLNNANGFTYLLGGIFLQWGTNSVPPTTSPGNLFTVTFPVPFTNLFVVTYDRQFDSPGGSNDTLSANNPPSNTQFSVRIGPNAISANITVSWIAIGN